MVYNTSQQQYFIFLNETKLVKIELALCNIFISLFCSFARVSMKVHNFSLRWIESFSFNRLLLIKTNWLKTWKGDDEDVDDP